MSNEEKVFTCLDCSKSYTRKSKLIEHFDKPQVKVKGILVVNKCFQSKNKNYGTSDKEVSLLKKQKSIASFQNQNEASTSGLSKLSAQSLNPINEAKISEPSSINEEVPSSQNEMNQNEFDEYREVKLTDDSLQPPELLQEVISSPTTKSSVLLDENNDNIEAQRYNNLIKNQEKMIALLEAGSFPQKLPMPNMNTQSKNNEDNLSDYKIYIKNAKSVKYILSNR